MSLLKRLKSFLGLSSPREPAQEEPVAVAVEREASTSTEDGDGAAEPRDVDEPEPTADTGEPASAAGEPDEETETEMSADTTDASDPETEIQEVDDSPVTDISGIGPAYSERLANADITTVSELAGADASELAAQIDVSETRLTGWIEAARERTDTG